MKNFLRASVTTLVVAASVLAVEQTPADYVNPLIDTHKSRWFYRTATSRLLFPTHLIACASSV